MHTAVFTYTHEGEGTILNSGGSVQVSETIGGYMVVTDKGTLNVATVSNCNINASGSSKVSVGKQTGMRCFKKCDTVPNGVFVSF